MSKRTLAVCLSPTFQSTMVFRSFNEDEVNRAVSQTLSASGKGVNVSRVLVQLGRSCINLTHLGGPRVQEFLDLCAAENLPIDYVLADSPIRVCTTLVNQARSTSTELVEEARPVKPELEASFIELCRKHFESADALIISGTKASGYSSDLFPTLVSLAKQAGVISVLDIKGQELKNTLSACPDVIKPNLNEFVDTFMPGTTVLENEESDWIRPEVEKRMRELYDQYGVKTVITRGKFATWAFDGKDIIVVPSPKIDAPIINTIGCGDTLTAAFTHSLLEGKSFYDSIAFGMECATRRATKLGHGIL